MTVSTRTCPGSTTGDPMVDARGEPIGNGVGDLTSTGDPGVDLAGETTNPGAGSFSMDSGGVAGIDLIEDLTDDPLMPVAIMSR